MPETVFVDLAPERAADPKEVDRAVSEKLGRRVTADRCRIVRRSIDARTARIRVRLGIQVFGDGETIASEQPIFEYQEVGSATPVIVVGAGPAGIFASLRLLEAGLKPVVIERGKKVKPRRRDVAALNRRGILDCESNYAFGEGGAGTFSDGKLYTRSKKRGDHVRVLHRFHQHGADARILVDAHPHIGSNRLPQIVSAMRTTITSHGGEIHFGKKVRRLKIAGGRAVGVVLDDGQQMEGAAVILATGHSAGDIYRMLADQGIAVEAKPFAMGVRVEHPQRLIDRIQYHGRERGAFLPPAAYSLVRQIDGRGVYSFCMCPGGIVVPAATQEQSVVVNGMSFAKRNSGYANAGIVVETRLEDIPDMQTTGPLGGLLYQQSLERTAFEHSGGSMVAPAQRLVDFVANRASTSLPPCSYPPGVAASPLHQWLPEAIRLRLQAGFKAFGSSMKGFLTNDAVVVGVESRTSSPVRIPRDPQTLQHGSVPGLFPCGEGAGYAGGIVSCAVDGERVAAAVAGFLQG
ncbi:FAD-dependent oxidoreductase [uncultured Desulfosarcina sp.]|uniref:NAD(P)/FAD-dependent oxidoreductase n=1 Tax=uncultured Desulfosarcina sp. TaxID=218289 RepID=UPI0029C8615E|nr:FAD-dependent oxidoreductase [uncultured Desulfosarcina sp.]